MWSVRCGLCTLTTVFFRKVSVFPDWKEEAKSPSMLHGLQYLLQDAGGQIAVGSVLRGSHGCPVSPGPSSITISTWNKATPTSCHYMQPNTNLSNLIIFLLYSKTFFAQLEFSSNSINMLFSFINFEEGDFCFNVQWCYWNLHEYSFPFIAKYLILMKCMIFCLLKLSFIWIDHIFWIFYRWHVLF